MGVAFYNAKEKIYNRRQNHGDKFVKWSMTMKIGGLLLLFFTLTLNQTKLSERYERLIMTPTYLGMLPD